MRNNAVIYNSNHSLYIFLSHVIQLEAFNSLTPPVPEQDDMMLSCAGPRWATAHGNECLLTRTLLLLTRTLRQNCYLFCGAGLGSVAGGRKPVGNFNARAPGHALAPGSALTPGTALAPCNVLPLGTALAPAYTM